MARRLLRLPALLLALLLGGCLGSQPSASPTPDLSSLPTVIVELDATTYPSVVARRLPTPPASNFLPYTSDDGHFSLHYPNDWRVEEQTGLVMFASPANDVRVEVRFAQLEQALDNEQLAEQAVDELKQRYAASYNEERRSVQTDKSVAIDFRITQTPDLLGKLFVETRGDSAYQLLMLVESNRSGDHLATLNYMISSYAILGQDAEISTPELRLSIFFNDLASALSDPLIDQEAVQLAWLRELLRSLPPGEREQAQPQLKSVLGEFAQPLREYRAAGADIHASASVENFRTRLVAEGDGEAKVEIISGLLRTTLVGDDVASLVAEDQRVAEKSLAALLNPASNVISLVQIDNVWYVDP